MNSPEYLTVAQFAAESQEAPITIRRRCAAGQIAATKLGGKSWRIHRSQLDAYMAPTNIPASSAEEHTEEVVAFETAAERRAARKAS